MTCYTRRLKPWSHTPGTSQSPLHRWSTGFASSHNDLQSSRKTVRFENNSKTTWKGRKKNIYAPCMIQTSDLHFIEHIPFIMEQSEKEIRCSKKVLKDQSGGPTCSSPKFHANWDHLEKRSCSVCQTSGWSKIKHVFRPWGYWDVLLVLSKWMISPLYK